MHLGRALGATVLAAGLLVGCSSTAPAPTAASATAARDVSCPTNGLEVPDAAPAPATPFVAELLQCQVALVDRGSQGWWLRITQRSATHDLGRYLDATRVSSRPSMTSCPAGAGRGIPPDLPLLAVDTQGSLHRLRLPTVYCGSVGPELAAIAGRLPWGPARTTWLRQVIPARSPLLGCLDMLREDFGQYWPLGSYDDGSTIHYVQQTRYTRDAVCALYPPAPTGPEPGDVVLGRRVTGGAERARAQRALDAHPGISGPDPIGRLMAPPGGMPPPAPCTRPTVHPYLLVTGAATLGYADLGGCLKAASTGAGLRSSELLVVVEQLQTSPYEP